MAIPLVLTKARATVILDHPFFASLLLRHPIVEDPTISTCCINGKTGQIRYNPTFVGGLTVNQTVHLLCHELLHYVGLDSMRVGSRNHEKWNVIADEWINDTLVNLKIGDVIPGGVYLPGASATSREDNYAKRPDPPPPPKQPKSGQGQGQGQGQSAPAKAPPGNGSGGDPMGGDIEYGDKMTEAEQHEHSANVKLELAEAANAAKARGNLPGILQKMVADLLETRTPWYDILERFLTDRVKNDVSWARPNRRYSPDFYLPILDGVGAMGEIAIQVDISGSVSKQEIAHYNGHLKRIIEQVHPSKVHVIYTDTRVHLHEEFDKPEEVQINYHSGGGTDMRAGLRYLEEKGIEPVVAITLTDGYTPFPEPGDVAVPMIWCISTQAVSPVGETVHFEMDRK
jgi:predicted metal-dependent peptidase